MARRAVAGCVDSKVARHLTAFPHYGACFTRRDACCDDVKREHIRVHCTSRCCFAHAHAFVHSISVRVSTVAAEFLDSVFELPVVNMREASPLMFQSNARLQLTSQYRAKLMKLKVRWRQSHRNVLRLHVRPLCCCGPKACCVYFALPHRNNWATFPSVPRYCVGTWAEV